MSKQPAQLLNEKIGSAVKERLRSSPYVPESSVNVLVDDRVGTLSGTVDSLKAKRVANSLAAQTTGVIHVRDRLQVRVDWIDRVSWGERKVHVSMTRDAIGRAMSRGRKSVLAPRDRATAL